MNDISENISAMVNYGMAISPFTLFVFSYNVMVQELLTALANYKAATFLSILENIVFANLATVLLPYIFGINGAWYSFLTCELLTLSFTIYCVYQNKDVYGYGKNCVATFIDN